MSKVKTRTYGQVELVFTEWYPEGYCVAIGEREHLQVVSEVNEADGIVVLSLLKEPYQRYPACLSFLFTHVVRRPLVDVVDHAASLNLSPGVREQGRINRLLKEELFGRSRSARFFLSPSIRYFES